MKLPLALVVEDDPDVAELYSHLLGLLGFSPEIRRNGPDTRDWLRANVPNLIILDLRLDGELSGLEILDRIREDARLIDTLVIVVSGYPRLTEGLREKADMVLLKPIDVRQLAGLIQRLQVGNPNLLPANFDPFDTRMLDEEVFIERVGYNLVRTRKQKTWFAVIAVRLTRTGPDGEIPEEIEMRLSSEAVRRMRRRLRLVDLTTRSDDGTVVVMLYEIREEKNALQIANRLTEILNQPFAYDDLEITHQASAGVVVNTPEMDDPLRMYALARMASKAAAQADGRVLLATEPAQE